MKKIFLSYSRADGGDFAEYIKEHYEKEGHQVYVDFYDLKQPADWSEIIRNFIAESDIVAVIVTRSALRSLEVEKEVLEARKQNKTIISCRYMGISWTELKWDLNKLQGFQFDNKNSLIRQLDEIIFSENMKENIISKSEENVNTKYYKKLRSSKATLVVSPVLNEATAAAVLLVSAIQGVRKFIPFQIERYSFARFPDKVDKNVLYH